MGTSNEKLFICYSHTDTLYKERLDKFLKSSALQQGIEIYSDAQIKPGEDWQASISAALREATAALVLVSQDFMISPFIQQVELRELLAAQLRRGLRLFLFPIRSTYYQGSYLEKFQWARAPDKPLSLLREEEQEQAMVDVCRLIAADLQKKMDAPTIEHNIRCLESIPKLDLPSIYELDVQIGEGEHARCYRAKDRSLDRTVIIKVLREELSRGSPAYDRYVRSTVRLRHRNIIGVLYSQTNKLPHFIVTPDINGTTWKERLAEPRPTLDTSLRWTIRLAEALHYAHGRNCVHGRVRSGEVRFDSDDEPMLSGFRMMQEPAPTCFGKDGARETLEDFIYSAPETRKTGQIDAATDQYLLGLLAYETIAGERMVALDSWASILDPKNAHALLNPPPLEGRAGCGARVSSVIMKALAQDPAKRWPDLGTFAEALRVASPTNTRFDAARASFDAARASYRRCARQPGFYEAVYAKLFELIPHAKKLFQETPLERQYAMLGDAIWLLLRFADSPDEDEPTLLSGVVRTHRNISASDYDHFHDAILAAVTERDSEPAAEAWRAAMAPGFKYLKQNAGAAISAAAERGQPPPPQVSVAGTTPSGA